jgi:NAD(P)H-hydrate epimerase
LKVVTAQQMREIERDAGSQGLSSEVLMENAGLAVAREVDKWLEGSAGHVILFLIGPGNNGGDGLVAARHLHDWGARVYLYLCSPRSDANYQLAEQRGIPANLAATDTDFGVLEGLLSSAEVVVDAIFGTGKTRPVEGVFKETLERLRKAKEQRPALRIIALDLPSGLDPDTGAVDPACVPADVTITLAFPKLGLFAFPGADKVGKLVICDIGIPPQLGENVAVELINEEWAASVLPSRPRNANKGTFGRVLVVAGSINYIGAAYLACAAAARVGAGLVTLATARSLQPILASRLIETTYIPLPESEPGILAAESSAVLQEQMSNYNVVLLGCGLGQRPQVMESVSSFLFSLGADASPSFVLDADALNIFARIPEWWCRFPREAIVTPHPGEMSRLTGLSVKEVQADRLGVALRAAELWRKIVVLKGAHTVVAAPDGRVKLSAVANPGLASAGTGDVLAGAIAGMLAQGLPLFEAAACGVYLQGKAGEMVGEELGDAGMLASDLLPALPLALKKLKTQRSNGRGISISKAGAPG